MKRFNILALCCTLTALALTGCGDGELTWEGMLDAPDEPVKVMAQEVEAEESSRLEVLQQKYGTADFTEEEYMELAELYLAESRNREAREVLELSCRMQETSGGYEMLQEIVVNLEEEAIQVKEMAELLQQNLGAEELFGEAIAMLYRKDWVRTMMPNMTTGSRNYYQKNQDNTFFLQVGYDAYGKAKTTLWEITEDKAVVIVQTAKTQQNILMNR